MARLQTWLLALGTVFSAGAAEREFDFSKFPTNALPKTFRSAVTGKGQPGEWRVISDAVPPRIKPLTPDAPVSRRPVLAQLAEDRTDEHFPLLIVDDEDYGDFTFTTRFKTVRGMVEQMAGVAFRIQDETNYYVVRASSIGNSFRFYKFVNGVRSDPIGPEVKVPAGVWHELSVECKGNQIRCQLNGQEVIPPLSDSSFVLGKIGFWTKSDSVSYFTDAHLTFTPRETLALLLVRDVVRDNPRLLGLKLFAPVKGQPGVQIVASKDPAEVGQRGAKLEEDVVAKDVILFGRDKKSVTVTLGLHDRNGDVMAAVRFVLTDFPGQTEQAAISRVLELRNKMEDRVRSAKSLLE